MKFDEVLLQVNKNSEIFDYPFLQNRKHIHLSSFTERDRFSLAYKVSDEWAQIFSQDKKQLDNFLKKIDLNLKNQLLRRIAFTFSNFKDEIGNFKSKLTYDTFLKASASIESFEKYALLEWHQFFNLCDSNGQNHLPRNPRLDHISSYQGNLSGVEIFCYSNSLEDKESCLGAIFSKDCFSLSQLNILPIAEYVNHNFPTNKVIILSTENTLMVEYTRNLISENKFENVLVFSHYTIVNNSEDGIIIRSQN